VEQQQQRGGKSIELETMQQLQQQQQQQAINSSNEPEPSLDSSTQVLHSKH